jgi:choline kinase
MKAVMLAAGMGTRLSGHNDAHPPKSLLRFGGQSLLARHIVALKALGIDELALVVGYHADALRAEVAAIGAGGFVRFLENPQYRRGSMVSLWTAREVLRQGETLYMDADVLYDPALLDRMMAFPAPTCFPIDRDFEEGDEPVKLCLRAGRPVEFRKLVGEVAFDTVGEWIGFIRMAADFAAELAAATERFVAAGRLDEPCEEAMRAVLLAGTAPVGTEDVTGIPWIEIDFPEDVARAEWEILPRIGA